MKFCPVCKTSYDEEILRFCTKDGTPLIEDEQPHFTALPSESDNEDLGEETVIRRKSPPQAPPTAEPVSAFEVEEERVSSPRIVIPMAGEAEPEPPRGEAVRAMTTESIRRQPPKSNTAMVVFLTVLSTVVVLAGAGGLYWFLGNQKSNGNQNVNYNTNFNSVDINLNTNLAVGNSLVNFSDNTNKNTNSNTNLNANANSNSNANLKTPTPTVTPSRTPLLPSRTPEEVETDVELNTNANISLPPPPTPRPTISPSPRDTPPPPPSNRPVNAGVLNGRAVNLPKPAYPESAKQMRADGQVAVQVMVDEAGNVISAKATSGNALLRPSAEAAARQSKFNPIKVRDQAVRATGFVIYNFVN